MPFVKGNKPVAGFDSHPENINKKGRPGAVSIKKELEKLLMSDGVIKYTGKQIVEIGEEAGKKFVKIKVPTSEALATKLITISMGKNDQNNTLKALIQLLEQFDGRPTQQSNVNLSDVTDRKKSINQLFPTLDELNEQIEEDAKEGNQ